jgi:hypothetical protein
MSLLTILNPTAGLVRGGLVAHYPFTENGGQVLTDVKGGFNGVLGSTLDADAADPIWSATGLDFDGVDDYVDLSATNPLFGATNRTHISVITPLALASSLKIYIAAGTSGAYDSLHTSGRYMCSASYAAGQASVYSAINAFTPGAANFVAVVRGTNTFRQHVGQTILTTPVVGVPVTSTPVTRFGQWGNGNFPSNVRLHTVLLYNRALSDREIQQNYRHLKRVMVDRGISI